MAVRFDAATDRITVAATLPDPVTAVTVTGWAYVAADTGTNATMCRIHAASGGSTTVTFATNGAAPAGPGYFTGGGSITSSTQSPVGVWRMVAFTCTGTSGNVWVAAPGGGTDNDAGTVAGTASPTGLTLGGRSAVDGSEWFNGRLAYWRVWSAVLSQAEIEAEWASTAAVRTSGLWADWPLETQTDLTDHSGNGRNLSAGSTATTTEDGPPLSTAITGSGAAVAPAATSSGTGTVLVAGTGAAVSPASAVSGTGLVVVGGTGASVSPTPVAAGAGGALVGGAGAASAPAASAVGSGGVPIAGSGSAVAPPAVASGSDSAPVPAPPERTFVVPAESRVYTVPAESRVMVA